MTPSASSTFRQIVMYRYARGTLEAGRSQARHILRKKLRKEHLVTGQKEEDLLEAVLRQRPKIERWVQAFFGRAGRHCIHRAVHWTFSLPATSER